MTTTYEPQQAALDAHLALLRAQVVALDLLDWPLTARGQEPLLARLMRSLAVAEAACTHGRDEAAAAHMRLAYALTDALFALHTIETLEV